MLTFLFWNLNGKDLTESLVRLVDRHNIDVLILAECNIKIASLLSALNPTGKTTKFHYVPGRQCKRIQIFVGFASQLITPIWETDRYTIRRLSLPGVDELTLVAAHLLSQLRASEQDLSIEITNLADDIMQVEAERKHTRTIVAGDLNMNPFSEGVVSTKGLHGVMTKDIAIREKRTVQRREYPFFYNPMWKFLGDMPNSPSGTYYYATSSHICYFWNTFDQILLRPALLEHWNEEYLQILTTDGVDNFLTSSGKPNKKNFSDHLPILFSIDLRSRRNMS